VRLTGSEHDICKLCILLSNGLWFEGVEELFAKNSAVEDYFHGLLVVDVAAVALKRAALCNERISKAGEAVVILRSTSAKGRTVNGRKFN